MFVRTKNPRYSNWTIYPCLVGFTLAFRTRLFIRPTSQLVSWYRFIHACNTMLAAWGMLKTRFTGTILLMGVAFGVTFGTHFVLFISYRSLTVKLIISIYLYPVKRNLSQEKTALYQQAWVPVLYFNGTGTYWLILWLAPERMSTCINERIQGL